MPRKLKIEGLRAELASLDALIQAAHEVGDPIGEYQLGKRRSQIERELRSASQQQERRASVALFFGGNPVLGSRGISAEFAGHMLENFQDLVARTFAAEELGILGERGPIPLKHATDLMVTNVTKGSFGFVLDEISPQEEIDDTALKRVVEQVVTTLEKVVSPNELDFEAVLEELDSRLLVSLKDFFSVMDTAEATLRLVDDVADIAFDKPSIHRGRLRTEATQIDESDITIEGVLEGFLPEHRKFELRLDTEEMLYGSVSKEAAEQYAQLVIKGETPVRRRWRVRLRQRVVTPLNRSPRTVNRLMEFLDSGT